MINFVSGLSLQDSETIRLIGEVLSDPPYSLGAWDCIGTSRPRSQAIK